jgi:hypothetical protein
MHKAEKIEQVLQMTMPSLQSCASHLGKTKVSAAES